MSECDWEVIDGFNSPVEYRRFCQWIDEKVKAGLIEEVPVQDYYGGPYFDEKWFKYLESEEKWRLVAPQAPFRGYWGPIS